MTPEQKEERRRKAAMMLAWFDGRELPAELWLDNARRLTDPKKYVDMHLEWLRNIPPHRFTFALGYYRLYEVKKLLEKNEENK